jgi:hypothetical protein
MLYCESFIDKELVVEEQLLKLVVEMPLVELEQMLEGLVEDSEKTERVQVQFVPTVTSSSSSTTTPTQEKKLEKEQFYNYMYRGPKLAEYSFYDWVTCIQVTYKKKPQLPKNRDNVAENIPDFN